MIAPVLKLWQRSNKLWKEIMQALQGQLSFPEFHCYHCRLKDWMNILRSLKISTNPVCSHRKYFRFQKVELSINHSRKKQCHQPVRQRLTASSRAVPASARTVARKIQTLKEQAPEQDFFRSQFELYVCKKNYQEQTKRQRVPANPAPSGSSPSQIVVASSLWLDLFRPEAERYILCRSSGHESAQSKVSRKNNEPTHVGC